MDKCCLIFFSFKDLPRFWNIRNFVNLLLHVQHGLRVRMWSFRVALDLTYDFTVAQLRLFFLQIIENFLQYAAARPCGYPKMYNVVLKYRYITARRFAFHSFTLVTEEVSSHPDFHQSPLITVLIQMFRSAVGIWKSFLWSKKALSKLQDLIPS